MWVCCMGMNALKFRVICFGESNCRKMVLHLPIINIMLPENMWHKIVIEKILETQTCLIAWKFWVEFFFVCLLNNKWWMCSSDFFYWNKSSVLVSVQLLGYPSAHLLCLICWYWSWYIIAERLCVFIHTAKKMDVSCCLVTHGWHVFFHIWALLFSTSFALSVRMYKDILPKKGYY